MLELLKVIVQPVVLERDVEGRVTGEKLGEPISLYLPEQLDEYVASLREQIEQANTASLNGEVKA